MYLSTSIKRKTHVTFYSHVHLPEGIIQRYPTRSASRPTPSVQAVHLPEPLFGFSGLAAPGTGADHGGINEDLRWSADELNI